MDSTPNGAMRDHTLYSPELSGDLLHPLGKFDHLIGAEHVLDLFFLALIIEKVF